MKTLQYLIISFVLALPLQGISQTEVLSDKFTAMQLEIKNLDQITLLHKRSKIAIRRKFAKAIFKTPDGTVLKKEKSSFRKGKTITRTRYWLKDSSQTRIKILRIDGTCMMMAKTIKPKDYGRIKELFFYLDSPGEYQCIYKKVEGNNVYTETGTVERPKKE